jgi:hypothetical protein
MSPPIPESWRLWERRQLAGLSLEAGPRHRRRWAATHRVEQLISRPHTSWDRCLPLISIRRRRLKRQDGRVPERPAAIKRLDALLSAAMIAHEAIFEMRRELIANDRGNAEQAGLLEDRRRS